MSMPIGRIASHLQGAAEIRQWTVQHIPFADTLVGHDLFVKIGSQLVSGLPLDPAAICRDLPYPEKLVRLHLVKLMHAGMLAPQAGVPAKSIRTLAPTTRFVALLKAYAAQLDHVYAVRRSLRQQQLHLAVPGGEMADFVEILYDHFHDLGWLYLHNYGSICFLMALLVRNAAQLHGYQARVESGYVEIFRPRDSYCFHLGGKAHLAPGQIAGHAFCVVDESTIVDFGLGNLRRAYQRIFPWGLACAFRPASPVFGGLSLPDGDTVTWRDDWRYPDTEAEFAKFEPLAAELMAQYRANFDIDTHRSLAPDSAAAPLDDGARPSAGAAGAAGARLNAGA